ncbi:Os01g0572966, partial [Oryza sativa Japonica Group]
LASARRGNGEIVGEEYCAAEERVLDHGEQDLPLLPRRRLRGLRPPHRPSGSRAKVHLTTPWAPAHGVGGPRVGLVSDLAGRADLLRAPPGTGRPPRADEEARVPVAHGGRAPARGPSPRRGRRARGRRPARRPRRRRTPRRRAVSPGPRRPPAGSRRRCRRRRGGTRSGIAGRPLAGPRPPGSSAPAGIPSGTRAPGGRTRRTPPVGRRRRPLRPARCRRRTGAKVGPWRSAARRELGLRRIGKLGHRNGEFAAKYAAACTCMRRDIYTDNTGRA